MASRTKKILAATVILATGLALAWPFRRTAPPPPHPAKADLKLSRPSPAGKANTAPRPVDALQSPVAAAPASLGDRREQSRAASPPPIVPSPPPAPSVPRNFHPPASEASDDAYRPVFKRVEPTPTQTTWDSPAPRAGPSHVIHNGDTLERLARRYLGDESRALEIFDLNREVLDNPHLLPIGTEIKIPWSQSNPPVDD